ncbi:MAG: FadR/GntR family transcriptional regulator [Pseudodesulfovibrio sp.]|jgi:DNA-binding FadR family transcriptional regulator|uniref:GntR family transcriptional regulator n=1 Tax=Pseudodesulfovibrio indicus TaxID=1716143 RepID=A0A140D915_9BACT|nr:GntR family transcriptional regulator [Pseudodesulfovibrio indicus]AMK09682.1 GntR family transcriptional regulator [Pseudodesulfovibrio indicus]TDT86362.1 GntR family transcriptional regulator [Pseudodesulfovibrio indicus]
MSETAKVHHLFLPVRAGRASEEVALQIEAAIVDGRLTPGERLPSEREMQTRFGTGRGVVREAIKILQQKGLLGVKKGAKGGAYVRQLDVGNVSESLALFLKQHPVEPEKLIEFRETLDRAITQMAMAHGQPAEKEALVREASRLESMLDAPDPDFEATSELDRKLNLDLARMARNPLFEWVMHALQMGFSSHDYALYRDPDYRRRAAANWSDTAKAIAGGDVMRALAYIGHHYVLLRQCVEERGVPTNGLGAEFLQEDNQQPKERKAE